MLRLTTAVATVVAVILGASDFGQQVPNELKGREFMRRKLDHAQKILEGLAQEDFELIEKNARMLSLLSQAAEWQVLPSAEYKQHSTEFRRTADTIAKMAADKNLDGSALKYVELTLNCVNCHKHVRSFPHDRPVKPLRTGAQNLRIDNPEPEGKPRRN